MVAIETNINITQVIETTSNDGKKEYYVLKDTDDANWIKINQSQYNEILRGNDNG